MTATWRTVLEVAWLALLVLAGWLVSQRLEMSGDLRKFMSAQHINSRAATPDAARAACATGRAACFSDVQPALQA